MAGVHLFCKERRISANEFRVNESIRVAEVRLIGPTGDNVGVVATRQALQMARDADLDLVEVAPNTTPPVCRIMDFGKFLYEREKKEREARKTQTKVEVKEIRLRPKTTDHHRDFKVEDARRWLEHNMKVRVTVRFRGREITYPEIALEDLKEIAQELSDVSTVEQAPAIEARSMSMLLAPSKGGKKKGKESVEEVPEKREQPRE
ncbi:MAG: translation initiation factor IF-3 [Anaerolineales bacterium]